MAQAVPATDIYAEIGDVASGSQVAVGHHIVQIGDVKGGIVYVQKEDPRPPRARPHPVSLRPRAFPGLLDRGTETSESIRALQSNESLECTGEPGAGKTSFLRHLAHYPQLVGFSAGVIYTQVNQQTNADLLKSLFDAFYEYDSPIKPTDTEIRHYLQDFKALILLDEVEIAPQQILQLMNVAPNCTFITATAQRILFGEAREVTLKGLPTADAVSLFERELGRVLSPEERNAAEHICELVGCIPQRILRAANQARDEKHSLVDIIPPDPSAPLDQVLATAEIESRSENEKKVLAALAVFYGAPVSAQHVAAVAEVSGAEHMLDEFERRGLVQSHDRLYTLSSDLRNSLTGDLTAARMRALAHFEQWVNNQRGNPEAIAKSAQPILLILNWGVSRKFWAQVTRVAHGTEEALALSGKWDMWGAALQSILESARAEKNRQEEAWALHQLGTRALCLGATAEAKSSLVRALEMRESLHDERGAAATRHNLNILLGPAPPEGRDRPGGDTRLTPVNSLLKFGVPALAAAALIVAGVFGWRWFADRRASDTNTSVIVGPAGVPGSVPPAPSAGPMPPPAPAQIMSFSAAPPAIKAGDSSQLCFQLRDASTVTIDGGVPGLQLAADRQCVTVAPATTTTYTLTASNSAGNTTTSRTTITVGRAPPQILSFSARPSSITDQGIVRLCYNVLNSDGLEIDNGVGTVSPQSEGCVSRTVSEATTFTLTATASGGEAVRRQVRVDVVHPPIDVEFTADPTSVTRPNPTSLCFKATRASSLSIDHGIGEVEVPPPGESACVRVQPSETTTYTLSAVGSFNRSATRRLTISVNAPPRHARIIDFHVSPTRIRAGERVQLCYEIADAARASLAPVSRDIPIGRNCVDDSPSRSTRYVLNVTGEDNQTDSRDVMVEVEEPPRVLPVRITGFEIRKDRRGSQLCFAVENAVSARIDPGVGAVRLPSDCRPIRATQPTTFTLLARDASGGTDQKTVSYTPPEPPREIGIRIIEFTPDSQTVNAGAQATICYRTFGVGTAQITPEPGSVEPGIIGERHCKKVSPKVTTVYTLTVTGTQGQQSKSVSVRVQRPVDVIR